MMRVRGCRGPCRGQRDLGDFGGNITLARSTFAFLGGYPEFKIERLRRFHQLTLHESLARALARQARVDARIDVILIPRAPRHGLSPGSMKKYKAAVARLRACRIPGPFYGPREAPPEAVDKDSIRVDLLPLFAAAVGATIQSSIGRGVLTDHLFPDKTFSVTS
jgi:hypothetical protein